MRLKVVSPSGFETFFTEKNCTGFDKPMKKAIAHAKKIGGKVFYENPSPYRFVKDGKTCKGSERWLPL